jgi:hypothetical protein
VNGLRHLLRRNALAAWAVIASALLMKAIVPAGFMPMMTTDGLAIVLCSGMAGGTTTATPPGPAAAMPGMAHSGMAHPDRALPDEAHPADMGHSRHGEQTPAKPDVPCAFAGLTAPSLGGVDIVLLAAAFAAILAAALLPRPTPPIVRRAFLRPPLRGPPASR